MEQTSSTSLPTSASVKSVLDNIWNLEYKRQVPTPDYPPISSIPRTSSERLERATPKECPDEHIPSSSPKANDYLYDHTAAAPTVLYLAYGSNLCAQTFLGQRGIRPISAVNVSAPSLSLTFDLPGFPYKEPCFANTVLRKVPKVPKPPKLPPGVEPPQYMFPPAESDSKPRINAHGDPIWDKGLIGVVYEVTPEDYATIVKTEGGGMSYQDILCPCIPLPQNVGVPEKPPFPELPKPFLAHTLFAPRIPTRPGDGDDNAAGDDGNNPGDDDGDDKTPLDKLKDKWRRMLLQPFRSDPDYAQPSLRYLRLIRDGAAEHGLPVDYQQWLARLQPYTITSWRQTIGQYLFLGVVMPLMGLFFALSEWVADDRGKIPAWLTIFLETVFHLLWISYDRVFRPIFGDGERTEEEEEKCRRRGTRRLLRKRNPGLPVDEEKRELLESHTTWGL